jgi:hypothetical protein
MTRFAYQPLSEEFAKLSQSGQVIMNQQDGHISVNKNGIIISKTREIEDKITDINELKHDVDEQSDVITNLLEDFKKFLENEFEEAEEAHRLTYIFCKKLLAQVEYMNSIDYSMRDKLDRIREIIRDFIEANNLQLARLDILEKEADEVLNDIGDMSYVENEYNIIMGLRNTYY